MKLHRLAPLPGVVLLLAALVSLTGGPLAADDRDLVRTAGASPYVFILFDNTYSMVRDLDGNTESRLDDSGDSKLYLAKEALYQVLEETPGVDFGFATFPNFTHLRANEKQCSGFCIGQAFSGREDANTNAHWCDGWEENGDDVEDVHDGYKVTWTTDVNERGLEVGDVVPLDWGDNNVSRIQERLAPNLALGESTPDFGVERYFLDEPGLPEDPGGPGGGPEACAEGSPELDFRRRRFDWDIQNNGDVTRTIDQISITWPSGNNNLRRIRFGGSTIWSGSVSPTTATIVSGWSGGSSRRRINPGQTKTLRFVFQSNAVQDEEQYEITVRFTDGCEVVFDPAPPVPACELSEEGLEFSSDRFDLTLSNDGSDPVTVNQIDISWPLVNANLNRIRLDGDTIWSGIAAPTTTSITSFTGPVSRRVIDPGDLAVLEFRFDDDVVQVEALYTIDIATAEGCGVTFVPDPDAGDFLRLVDEEARPFFAWGNTPLEGVLRSFDDWYGGWEPLAETNDPEFAADCRPVYVILLTDGFETCGGSPVPAAQDLFDDHDIRTYVIGFAVNNPQLDAIAAAGQTGTHYPAADQQGLIDALTTIVTDIQRTSQTFASAAVPSVSAANDEEQIHLTSFSPVDGVPVWPARIDAYDKPLPFTTNFENVKVPDRSEALWDAGQVILSQAPTEAEVNGDNFKVGNNANQRRIYYAEENTTDDIPATRRFFVPSSDSGRQLDLYGPTGFGFDPISPTFVDDGEDVIRHSLKIKEATIVDPISGADDDIEYVVGDVFHSDPFVLAAPNNLAYFSADMSGRVDPCGERLDGQTELHPPYPCFAIEHQFRRKVLYVGSNEGALHAFDAGQPFLNGDGEVEYTSGSGSELFAFVPRGVLPAHKRMASGGGQEFTVDGPVTIGDAVVDSIHTGIPSNNDRHWRTLAIGGLREGGKTYYALDITMPDQIDSDFLPIAPTYVPSCATGNPACKSTNTVPPFGPWPPRAYPLVLWEFSDELDETNNDLDDPDLGFTWSKPNIGRIRVLDSGGDVIEKYVAVFGGGLDAAYKHEPVDEDGSPNPRSGNFLYMVDVETGETIYKRRLDIVNSLEWPAMVPSEPAAVDTDFDSYLDTIYIGTTAGHLFKVDISQPQEIVTTTIDDYAANDPGTGLPPLERTVERITASEWEPFPIFSTGGRPIYYPPSVIFVAELNKYALAFGTGDREDLFDATFQEGRFYTFLDGGFSDLTPNLPFTESKLARIEPDDPDTSANFLFDITFDPSQVSSENPGWYLVLGEEERVLNKSLSLSGIVSFSSFVPDPENLDASACGAMGASNLFVVQVTNANGLLGEQAFGSTPRYRTVNDLVTTPFVESGASNVDQVPDDPTEPPPVEDDPCAGQDEIVEKMMAELFPANCNFANYTLNIQTIRAGTGIECVAPVPICIVERNWKEF